MMYACICKWCSVITQTGNTAGHGQKEKRFGDILSIPSGWLDTVCNFEFTTLECSEIAPI